MPLRSRHLRKRLLLLLSPHPQKTSLASSPGCSKPRRRLRTRRRALHPLLPSRSPDANFTRMFQAPTAPPPVQGTEEIGVSTRIFQIPVMKQEPPPAAPTIRQGSRRTRSPVSSPGSFKLPRSPAAGAAAPSLYHRTTAVYHSGPDGARAGAGSSASGEFTRMFQAPSTAPDPPVPPQASQPSGPGEFTRMFQTPPAGPPQQPIPPVSQDRPFITPDRPARTPDPPKSGPGEFTAHVPNSRAPRAPLRLLPPLNRPNPESSPGFFKRPSSRPRPGAHPAYKDPFAKAQEPAAPESGAGEFTRMFGVPAVSANALLRRKLHLPSAAQPRRAASTAAGAGRVHRMFSAPVQPMQRPSLPRRQLPASSRRKPFGKKAELSAAVHRVGCPAGNRDRNYSDFCPKEII